MASGLVRRRCSPDGNLEDSRRITKDCYDNVTTYVPILGDLVEVLEFSPSSPVFPGHRSLVLPNEMIDTSHQQGFPTIMSIITAFL